MISGFLPFVAILVPVIASILCAFIFLNAPAFRCASFAFACFVTALPFYFPLFDQTTHGHPDLRGTLFLSIAVPLFAAGAIASVVGFFRISQHSAACVAAFIVNAAAPLLILPLTSFRIN